MYDSRKRQGPPESSGLPDRASGQYGRVSGAFCTFFLLGFVAPRPIGTFDSRREPKLRKSRLIISTFDSITTDAANPQPFRLNALVLLIGLRQPYVTVVPSLFHPTTYCMVSSDSVKPKIFQEKQEISKRFRWLVVSVAVSASRYEGGKVVDRRGVSAQWDPRADLSD
jgi:hypothetical protein